MANTASNHIDEECANKIENLLESLKESNEFLGVFVKEITDFQIELTAFKEKLSDQKFAARVHDLRLLEAVDSVFGYMTEELEVLKELEADLNRKLRELEIFIESDYIAVLLENNYFFELLAAITNIKKTVLQKVKEFNQNTQVSLLRKMLIDSKDKMF